VGKLLLSVVCFIFFTLFGFGQIVQATMQEPLIKIEKIFWGHPNEFLSINIYEDEIAYSYLQDTSLHVAILPVVVPEQHIDFKKSSLRIAELPKIDTVKYIDSCPLTLESVGVALIVVTDTKTKKVSLLIDPLGIGLIFCKQGEHFYLSPCWDSVLKVLELVEKELLKKRIKATETQLDLTSKKFREYYGPPPSVGMIDAQFMAYVFKDKKICGVPFKKIKEILERKNVVENLVDSYNIDWSQFDYLNSGYSDKSYTNYVKLARCGFEELEKLVGLRK
jgi:hypothetical protein